MSDSRQRKAEKIRSLLRTEGPTVRENTTGFNKSRYQAYETRDDIESLRETARGIKESAIEDLPSLIETVQEAVSDNGGTVYLADDAADANEYIEQVATDTNAETVVKSKSMTTEEIHLNDHLHKRGIDVYETDLGEFVIQLADEAPSHLIGPAIHKSREEIATLFNTIFEPDEPLETAEELTRFARDYLGDRITEADIGITGANFVLAESGTIVLVTNEGNARKSAVTPNTHIAVTGVEKLIPSVNELGPFVELIARAGTGQDIAQYITMLSPPVDTAPIDFDHPDTSEFGYGEAIREPPSRDFHLVLIDNGRLDMRTDDQLRETLYCIRCGACANSCANFQQVGGHAFGGETYTGGIATGWETGINGLETAAEFNDLCTGCTRCVPACPVKIDIPWINTVVRDRINHTGNATNFDYLVDGLLPSETVPANTPIEKRFFGNFGFLASLGSKIAPVSNALMRTRVVRRLAERFIGVDARRPFPQFANQTLVSWHESRSAVNPTSAETVVLYPDLYTNYFAVDRGKAAIKTLEALGHNVTLSSPVESGRAPLSQGLISTAESHAHSTYSTLEHHLNENRPIIIIEPSDLMMFRRDYERFLPADAFTSLATNTYELFEYLHNVPIEEPTNLSRGTGSPITYHSHCQQRTLHLAQPTIDVLESLDYPVVTTDVECCGMAGSFGYKSPYYELSVTIGETLTDTVDESQTIVASGTSCAEQLSHLLNTPVKHPVELIAPDS